MKRTIRKRRVLMVMLFLAILATSILSGHNSYAANSDSESEKAYIIITKDEKSVDKVQEKYDNILKDENKDIKNLNDENIIVSTMTENEKYIIETDSNVILVEEDVNVAGSGHKNGKEQKNSNKPQPKSASNAEWNLQMINADNQVNNDALKSKVKVAIIDSGVNYSDDIDVIKRKNFIPGEEELSIIYEDELGHGTSVAGIIAAKDNGLGITGINSNVELYSAKVLDSSNEAPISRVIEAINWAIEEDADIINMSFGTSVNSFALHSAIQNAYNHGILIVAAAGNGSIVEYPGAYDEVIAVGSVGTEGKVCDNSAHGEQVELLAPGEQIRSTGIFDGIMTSGGTSMAAPHVTAIASLLWQKDKSVTADFIRQLLDASAKGVGNTDDYGYGVIDLEYALNIYDDVKCNYIPNNGNKNEFLVSNTIEKNAKSVESFENVNYVEGRWSADDHKDLAGLGDFAGNDLAVIVLGAKANDKYLGHMSINPQWHGYTLNQGTGSVNYIACYILATKMAKDYRDGSYSDPSKVAGMEQSDYDAMCGAIGGGINGYSWKTVLDGKSQSGRNKSLFMYGMALHIATDAFAHSTYKGGAWIDHPTADETGTNRWTCAKQIATKVLNKASDNTTGSVKDFVLSKYNGNFKLCKVSTFANNVNSTIYKDNKTFFDNMNVY